MNDLLNIVQILVIVGAVGHGGLKLFHTRKVYLYTKAQSLIMSTFFEAYDQLIKDPTRIDAYNKVIEAFRESQRNINFFEEECNRGIL